MVRIPPVTDERAKAACAEVAQEIAGPNPPVWFLNYLEQQMCLLAGHRCADDERIKENYRSRLELFRTKANALKKCLEDPILIGLLKEKKWQVEAAVIRSRLDDLSSEESLPDVLMQARGEDFYDEHSIIGKLLDDFIIYADFALEIPELQGRGRGHVYLRGNVSPKQICAFIILVARHHFKLTPLAGRPAYQSAQSLWIGCGTALEPSVILRDETSQYASDRLGRWRPYFHKDKQKLHFAAFDDCRIRLALCAHLVR